MYKHHLLPGSNLLLRQMYRRSGQEGEFLYDYIHRYLIFRHISLFLSQTFHCCDSMVDFHTRSTPVLLSSFSPLFIQYIVPLSHSQSWTCDDPPLSFLFSLLLMHCVLFFLTLFHLHSHLFLLYLSLRHSFLLLYMCKKASTFLLFSRVPFHLVLLQLHTRLHSPLLPR